MQTRRRTELFSDIKCELEGILEILAKALSQPSRPEERKIIDRISHRYLICQNEYFLKFGIFYEPKD